MAITGVEVAAQRQRQVAVFEALKAYTYDLADQLERVPGTGRLLVDLYDRNIGNIDAVSRLVGETQASARERAVNLLRKGDQLLQLGDAAAAEAAFQLAGPLLERVAASGHGNPEFRRDLANYHQRMGNARLAQGDAAGALADYRTSLAIVDELLASAPDNPRLRRDAALGHAKLADALLARGDAAAAAGEYLAGIARAEALASGTAVGWELAVDLAEFHDGAARAYAKAGRRDDADAVFVCTVGTMRRYVDSSDQPAPSFTWTRTSTRSTGKSTSGIGTRRSSASRVETVISGMSGYSVSPVPAVRPSLMSRSPPGASSSPRRRSTSV